MKHPMALYVALLCAGMCAGLAPTSSAATLAPIDVPARQVSKYWLIQHPHFPMVDFSKLGKHGQTHIVLSFIIDAYGRVEDVSVVAREPAGLDPAPFVSAVRQDVYAPAPGNKRRVPVRTTTWFNFGGADVPVSALRHAPVMPAHAASQAPHH